MLLTVTLLIVMLLFVHRPWRSGHRDEPLCVFCAERLTDL
jgi:hypothetical protein